MNVIMASHNTLILPKQQRVGYAGNVEIRPRGIEDGNIFQLGDKYTKTMTTGDSTTNCVKNDDVWIIYPKKKGRHLKINECHFFIL